MNAGKRTSKGLLALAGVASVFIVLPLVSVVWRTPFSDLFSIMTSTSSWQALRVSLQTSVVATFVSCLLGVPLAWWLARSGSRAVRVVRTLSIAPMVLPPVVGGIALLTAFGRRGLVGESLFEWFGISLPFTVTAVVMAQVFVSMPFLVVSVEAAFRQAGTDFEDAARTLGAGPSRVFWRVALPAARPSLAAGAVLAWARSLGEFGATITFAGSLPGRTQTLPMAVYEFAAVDYRQSLVLSLVLIVISVAVLTGLRERWIGAVTR